MAVRDYIAKTHGIALSRAERHLLRRGQAGRGQQDPRGPRAEPPGRDPHPGVAGIRGSTPRGAGPRLRRRNTPGDGAAVLAYHDRELMGLRRAVPYGRTVERRADRGLVPRSPGRGRGDLRRSSEIVRRYQRRVYGVALRIVRAPRRGRRRGPGGLRAGLAVASTASSSGRPFGPWVCRIAANLAVNHVRSPARPGGGAARGPRRDALGRARPARRRARRGGAARSSTRRSRSPAAEQRAVFVLRAVEEMSYAEIAAALGISQGTVMSRLFRARERLAKALAPYLGRGAAGGKAGAS